MLNRRANAPQEDFLVQVIQRYLAVLRLNGAVGEPLEIPYKSVVRTFERTIIRAVLDDHLGHGQYDKTAERLGIHRNSLRVKMKQLKIYVRRRKSPVSITAEAVLGR